MKTFRITYIFLFCLLIALPLSAQESAMEQFMTAHSMSMLTADSIDPNHDDLVITALAMQQLTRVSPSPRSAQSKPAVEPAPLPCVLQIDTVSGRAELLSMTGLHLAEVHFTLVDSTWYMWLSVDPLADKNIQNSPYMYCNGNPVMLIDPDGRDEWQYDENSCKFTKIGDKGGAETDYYQFGSFDKDGNFIISSNYSIDRNGRNTINSFRIEETSLSTISVFHIPDAQENEISQGFFLEPKGPDTPESNQNKRIPQGVYGLVHHNGSSFSDVPRLYKFEEGTDKKETFWSRAVLIHTGNSYENTRACLLPGSSKSTNWVSGSTKTLNSLKSLIEDRGYSNMQLVIINAIILK